MKQVETIISILFFICQGMLLANQDLPIIHMKTATLRRQQTFISNCPGNTGLRFNFISQPMSIYFGLSMNRARVAQ